MTNRRKDNKIILKNEREIQNKIYQYDYLEKPLAKPVNIRLYTNVCKAFIH